MVYRFGASVVQRSGFFMANGLEIFVSVRAAAVTDVFTEDKTVCSPFLVMLVNTVSFFASSPSFAIVKSFCTVTVVWFASRSGVVTIMPFFLKCTASVIVRLTSRVMPLPEYHRLDGTLFSVRTAITLVSPGFNASVISKENAV